MTAAVLGPAGWIIAQGLDWINHCVDSGSQTCGLDFIYEENKKEETGTGREENEKEENVKEENKEEGIAEEDNAKKENDEEEITEEENAQKKEEKIAEQENKEQENVDEDRNRTMRESILDILFKREVNFLSVTGR